jgi:hypothetical protein
MNVPCEQCGRTDLPLHTDNLCPDCSPKSQPMIGYYSHQQAEKCGRKLYATPDGKQVQVTMVSAVGNTSLWPDVQVVGEVTRFIRIIDKGTNNSGIR